MLNFCVAVQDFLVLSYLEECLGKERKNTATGDTGGHPGELVLSTHSLFQHLRAIMHVTAVPKAQLSCMTCTSISKFQQITLTVKQPFFPHTDQPQFFWNNFSNRLESSTIFLYKKQEGSFLPVFTMHLFLTIVKKILLFNSPLYLNTSVFLWGEMVHCTFLFCNF